MRLYWSWRPVGACVAGIVLTVAAATSTSATSLRDAVSRTVRSNPSIEAARSNRRAAGFELKQAQGRLLPELNVNADVGRQLVDRPEGLSAENNDKWRTRRQVGVTVRQILFDAWDRANDVYKNASRLDASAHRVMERSELLALDAVEAYIDVRRHRKVLGIAKRNVRRHRRILGLVDERRRGGKAADSESIQTRERIAAARAIVAQIEQSLLEANAKFRRVVGIEPRKLDPVGFPAHLPNNRARAVAIAASYHPALKAADADVDTARFAYAQSRSENMPIVALEGRANYGRDLDGTPGRDEDYSGRVVLNWRLFDGRIGRNRRRELAARRAQAEAEREARRRAVREAIERAFAAYFTGGKRVASLRQRASESRRVIRAYEEEYKASKRTLIDLLDSENAFFSSQFQLESVRAVHIFSAYQLAASIGQLLEKLGIEPPAETVADHREQSRRRWGVVRIEIEPLRKR